MNPVSILPVLPIILLVLSAVTIFGRLLGIPVQKGRYISIDGLRGYLAIFVFLHHSSVWFFLLHYGQWAFPPSHLYNHFGPTSVAMFFMITSFLFFTKLLQVKNGSLDWVRLYTSRVLRIMPLYLFALMLLFLIVAVLSQWKWNEPVSKILGEAFGWILFMEPDINLITGTKLIVAGVVWSLAFEWIFYFSLPIWGFFLFNIKVPTYVLIFSALGITVFLMIILDFYPFLILPRMSPFLTGMLAAFLSENGKIKLLAKSIYTSFVMVFLLVLSVIFYDSAFTVVPFICISIIFFAIACGNTLFGIFSHPASCLLGQVSYSIYLLHGILLFATFRFVLGFPFMINQPVVVYWTIIAGISLLLIVCCTFTFLLIEHPAITATPMATAMLRRFWQKTKRIFQKEALPSTDPQVSIEYRDQSTGS